MKILALDFSSQERSVAVLAKDRSSTCLTEVLEAAGSAGPLSMIDQALRQAHVEREQIQLIAVGLGPGSYTGIRSSLALAQGWSLAKPARLVGVPSHEAIALGARSDGLRGMVSVVIDAQRGEFYLAGFDLDTPQITCTSALRLATPDQVRAEERSGRQLIGPEVRKWFPNGLQIHPRAGTVARLAAERGIDHQPTTNLEPIYLREVAFVKAPPPRLL